ncbi:hypothetical protein OROMI_031611 [Orobanche minor]
MYPFERYMKVCKGYVRNRTRPEGCIAECYITEEAIEFLAELFCDERTVGMPSAPITLDRRTSGDTVVSVYGKLYDQAHLCVLQNTVEFRDYFNEHCELLKLEFPRYAKDEKWLTDKQNKTFADWVKARVATQLSEPGHKIPEIYSHWVLTIIDPENEKVYYLDPIRRRLPLGSCEWKTVVNSAIGKYNEYMRRTSLKAVEWKPITVVPHQPDAFQCGYYVMRYMRDIVEDKDQFNFVTKRRVGPK